MAKETAQETAERQARQAAEMDRVMDAGTSTDLARNNGKRIFDDSALRSMTSFADAADALNSVTTVESFSDYGNGFKVLDSKDKKRLVGVPLLILEWRNNTGDNGDFVSFACITKNDEKFIVNDGSTGIRDQLKGVQEMREGTGHPTPQAGLLVPRGLRESTYDSPTGQGKATTYYLSTDKD